MIDIGSYNTLRVLRLVDFGAYLGNLESGQDVLIPKRYCPEGLTEGDDSEVFIDTDSEDRIIATTETPLAIVGECAFLDVKDINDFKNNADLTAQVKKMIDVKSVHKDDKQILQDL